MEDRRELAERLSRIMERLQVEIAIIRTHAMGIEVLTHPLDRNYDLMQNHLKGIKEACDSITGKIA